MENKCYKNTNNNTGFTTNLQVGEVVIVVYTDARLNYNRHYVSVVKDIVIDKENNIYQCRIDNFNIDFELYGYTSAVYDNSDENIYAYIYKIEDYEQHLNSKSYYINLHSIYDVQKDYKVLIEAMKLKEQLQQK